MEIDEKRPIRQYVAYGPSGIIGAAVWKRERRFKNGKVGHYPSVSISRRYKDRETQTWKTSSSFSVSDLRKLSGVIERVIADLEAGEARGLPAEHEEVDLQVAEQPAPRVPQPQQPRSTHQARGDVCVVY